MARLEAPTESWIRPDPNQKGPKRKTLSMGGFTPSESLQPRHDTVEIQGAQSQTTSTTSANANGAESDSDAAHPKRLSAQLWLDTAAHAKAQDEVDKAAKAAANKKIPKAKNLPRWPLSEFASSASSPLQRYASAIRIIPSLSVTNRLDRFNLSRLDHEQ